MLTLIFQSIKIVVVMTVLLGIGYPLIVTGVSQVLFSRQANGSLITVNNKVIASELLAQKIESSRLFWPRPSASDFGTLPSGASNQGPTSEILKFSLQKRKALGFTHEMLFASGSGLDPHISMDAATSQLPRIVESRNLGDNEKKELIVILNKLLQKRDFGFLGEERVNVLNLNLKVIERFGR